MSNKHYNYYFDHNETAYIDAVVKHGKISNTLYKIGADMAKNHPRYSDVVCDPGNGIVPRCLIYEEDSRDRTVRGSVVVGINPGRLANARPSSKADREREFYKNRGGSYDAVLEFWNKEMKDYRYYKYGRLLVDKIGLHGPILWTELVKCESPEGIELSVQTIRDSINRYLFKELEVIPKDWPLFAVGNEAFKILSYRFPDRIVLGIPHITSSRGQFHNLLSRDALDPTAKSQLDKILNGTKPVATAFRCSKNGCQFDYHE